MWIFVNNRSSVYLFIFGQSTPVQGRETDLKINRTGIDRSLPVISIFTSIRSPSLLTRTQVVIRFSIKTCTPPGIRCKTLVRSPW